MHCAFVLPPQQDIHRGKGMVDSLFQGFQNAGTQNSILSSQEYLSQAARTLNNIEVRLPALLACLFHKASLLESPYLRDVLHCGRKGDK